MGLVPEEIRESVDETVHEPVSQKIIVKNNLQGIKRIDAECASMQALQDWREQDVAKQLHKHYIES